MIHLIRCDDRLIHGQCMTRLVQHYFIRHIIVIDEFSATNPTMRYVIERIALPGMKNDVYTLQDALEPIRKALHDDTGTMIVFRFPEIARDLFDALADLPPSLMIGPVQKRDQTLTVCDGTYLTREEITLLHALYLRGIEIFFQAVPGNRRIEFQDFYQSIREEKK